jgi:hypothetical protein
VGFSNAQKYVKGRENHAGGTIRFCIAISVPAYPSHTTHCRSKGAAMTAIDFTAFVDELAAVSG